MRTWAAWDENTPGSLEIELVGPESGDANGEFAYSLTVTDIVTSWTKVRTVRNKAARHMFAALVEIQAALPFPRLGIDSTRQRIHQRAPAVLVPAAADHLHPVPAAERE
jgi:hypothetical protein